MRAIAIRPLPCQPLIALLCAWLLTTSAGVQAVTPATAATTAELAARIDAHIDQARFAAAEWGIAAISLDSGRTVYAHQADRLLQPASTAKLFTAAVSLATLGPDYRIATRVLASGALRDGRLEGRLILYGMGDPTLGTATSPGWADQLAGQLAAHGVHSVHGDLIADDSYFASPSFGAGWEAGDLQSWFAVPSSALSVQENVVDLTIGPGRAAGAAAVLQFTPADAAMPMLGRLSTSAARMRSDVNLYRALGEDTLHVFGQVAAGSPPQHFKLALPDPAWLAGRRLRQALMSRGIRVSGKLQVVHWPQDDSGLLANARPLAESFRRLCSMCCSRA